VPVAASLHDGMFVSGDLVLPPASQHQQQQQQPTQLPVSCSSPDQAMIDAVRHSAPSAHPVFEMQMTDTW